MEFFIDLWLAIVAATLALHTASFISWTVFPHHFADKKKLADEDKVMELVRELNIPPGNYMFPYTTDKQTQSDKDFIAKYKAGPVGCLDVYTPMNMGKNIAFTILFFFVTSSVIAYITHVAYPPSDPETTFLKVFRFAGTVAILTYASSGILNRIWFQARKITDFIDGCVFGLILGLIFAALYKYPIAS